MKYIMGFILGLVMLCGTAYADCPKSCKCDPCKCVKCECVKGCTCGPDCKCGPDCVKNGVYKSVERKWPFGRMQRTTGPDGKSFSIHILRIPIYRKSVTFGNVQPMPETPAPAPENK